MNSTRSRRWLSATLVAVLGAVLAAPAGAEDEVVFREERVYFTCAGDTKAQNLSAAQGELPGWGTTPPSASVTAGAGCGFYDNYVWISSLAPDETFRATWQGTFTGNLDAMLVEAHNIYVGEARLGEPFEGAVRVLVDGAQVVLEGFQVTPEPSDTGLSEKILVPLAGLGFGEEEGEGTITRTITVELASSGASTHSVWVWDTTEVPAGITFNPPELLPPVFHLG